MAHLNDRLLRLLLTLPVSTASIECAFSTLKIIKIGLRNTMENEFLRLLASIYVYELGKMPPLPGEFLAPPLLAEDVPRNRAGFCRNQIPFLEHALRIARHCY